MQEEEEKGGKIGKKRMLIYEGGMRAGMLHFYQAQVVKVNRLILKIESRSMRWGLVLFLALPRPCLDPALAWKCLGICYHTNPT